MVTRARDLERLGKFNKLISFFDPSGIAREVSLPYGEDGIGLGYSEAGRLKAITSFADVDKVTRLIAPRDEFFTALEDGDKVRLTFGGGHTVQVEYVDRLRQSAKTSAVGSILEGEPVTVENLSGGKDLTVWGRIDDSTLSDSPAYARVSRDAVMEVGSNTRRVLFIQTRANPAVTVDHQVRLDGLLYEIRSIQELHQRGELRLALVRV